MDLNYIEIFNIFVDMLKTALPISIFLYLANMLITFSFLLLFQNALIGGLAMENEINTIQEVDISNTVDTYNIFYNMYTIMSVLTFTIIVVFLYKYLKNTLGLSFRR